MASSPSVDVPDDVRTVARRYWRLTLVLRGLLVVGYVPVCPALLAVVPFVPALVAIAVLLATLRLPLFTVGGTITIESDVDPAAVRAAFAGTMPPVLAFQAALADDIRPSDAGAEFDLSSPLDVSSTTMETEVYQRSAEQASGGGEGDETFELVVTVGGGSLGTYAVSTREQAGSTRLRIEVESDRRLGLRRLPDWIVARRYRKQAFAVQGYRLLDETSSLSVR